MIPGDDEPRGDEVREEIEFHIACRAERLIREGWPEARAWEEARRRFGDRAEVRAGMERELRLGRWTMGWKQLLEGLVMDARVGLRSWRRTPVTGLTVILTLALGIGATTAIFSLVYGVLLRPLPFPEPERLTSLWVDVTERGGPEQEWFSFANLHDLREEASAFSEVGIYGGWNPVLTGRGDPTVLAGGVVSAGFLDGVLGVEPVRGRLFLEAEDRGDGPAVVVVSHGFWQETLGAPGALDGVSVVLNGTPFQVVGVLPPGFRSPVHGEADAFRLVQIDPVSVAELRGNFSWRAIARLAPGVTLARAQAELDAFSDRMASLYPDSNTGMAFSVVGLRSDLVANARTGLLLVLGMVGLVLLLTCVNVANLIVARNSQREAAFAIRATLGSSRGRLLRQLLVETGLLAAAGGLLGLALAVGGTDALVALAPEGTPRIESVRMDGGVLAVGAATTLLVALFTGLFPGLSVGGRSLRAALATQDRGGGSHGGSGLRRGLVVVQVGIAVALLTTASLLTRSFAELRTVDLGYEPDGVLTFFLGLPGEAYQDRDARAALAAQLEPRLAGIPGVRAAGAVSALPLAGFDGDVSFSVEGQPPPERGESRAAWIRRVTPGYFDAMGLEVVSGRAIDARDQAGTPNVILVNQTLADRYFPDGSPLGQRLNLGSPEDPLFFEIAGVVRNIRHFGIRDDWRNAIYIANTQFPGAALFFAVDAAGEQDPTSLVPAVRAAVAEIDPSLALTQLRTMESRVAGAMGSERFLAWLLGGFAVLALILASVGLYGVVNFTVNSRMRELAVRFAMGAGAGEIRWSVVRGSLPPVLLGLGVGAVLAWIGARAARSVLYGVSPSDPTSFGVTALLLGAVALAAAAGPALRASRVPPMRVLREE